MKHDIKAVCLDLGEVLIQLDFTYVMRVLGVPDGQTLGDALKTMDQWNLYDRFERGHISEAEFFGSRTELKEVWNSVLGEPVPGVPELIENVRFRTRLVALTNTNETHLRKAFELYPFLKSFERVFSSHEIGARKPEREIYESVERSLSLKGSDILFVDDRIENVEGARKAGWRAEHCKKSPDDLMRILSDSL